MSILVTGAAGFIGAFVCKKLLETTNNMDDNRTLKWRFDVSTFRLIGRDLITDRVTALFELVKNCYDANAQHVYVIFENVGVGKSLSVIRVEDDGYGMSFEDIRDKWMVIVTLSKRTHPYSPEPYNRKCVGEKVLAVLLLTNLETMFLLSPKRKVLRSGFKLILTGLHIIKSLKKKQACGCLRM